jgi:hypothetical protein
MSDELIVDADGYVRPESTYIPPSSTNIISSGDIDLVPLVINGYESSRQSGNLVHPIMGRANPDITFRPAMLRTGTLRLVFLDETASKQAEDEHAIARVWQVITPDRLTVEMSYVTNGSIVRTLDDATRDAWIVSIDYQEVES